MVAPYSVERAWCSRRIRHRSEPANARKIAAPPSGLGVHRREGCFGCNRRFGSFYPGIVSPLSSRPPHHNYDDGVVEKDCVKELWPSWPFPMSFSAFLDLGSHGESTRPPSFSKWTHRWSTLNGFPSLPVKFPVVCSRYDYARASVFKAVSLFCLNPFVDFVVQTLGSSFVFPGHVCLCTCFDLD
ncbi:hypothetical protein GQ457_09G002150 [Hibiscus cannabinus]